MLISIDNAWGKYILQAHMGKKCCECSFLYFIYNDDLRRTPAPMPQKMPNPTRKLPRNMTDYLFPTFHGYSEVVIVLFLGKIIMTSFFVHVLDSLSGHSAYLRAVFISFSACNCMVCIQGWHLLEGSVYSRKYGMYNWIIETLFIRTPHNFHCITPHILFSP